jgi:hypothetical protein
MSSTLSFRHIFTVIIVSGLLVTGTVVGIHYASSISGGTASVGFQGNPESGVSHIYLTISQITFQGGVNTTDAVYLNSPVTFDLLSLVNVTRMLGDFQVNPGHYNMIRFVVSSAIATIHGVNTTLKLPSGEVKVPIQFDVVHGMATSIVLNIAADDTLIVHSHILRPVVTGVVEGPN